MARSGLSKGEKTLLLVTALFVALVGLAVYWWHDISAMPEVTIPNLPQPSPNARDYFLAAAKLCQPVAVGKYRMEFADANLHIGEYQHPPRGPRHLPPAGFTGSPRQLEHMSFEKADPSPSLADMEALVTQNAGVFAKLRQGLRYEYGIPVQNMTKFAGFTDYRNIARAFSVASFIAAERGEWPQAMTYHLDGLAFGEAIQHQGNMLTMLTGKSIAGMSRHGIWTVIDHLDATDARAAARRLESIRQHSVTYAEALESEKRSLQCTLLDIFQREDFRTSLAGLMGGPGNYTSEPDLKARLKSYTVSKRRVMDNVTHYLDAQIADAKLPYASVKKPIPIPNDPFSRLFFASSNMTRGQKVHHDTQNALLLVTLALRAYRLEHGVYPAGLPELTPDYLQRIPDDPFAVNSPLQYHRSGNGYVLYSIGPDGKDDGGIASKDGQYSQEKKRNSSLKMSSTGDVVAGVNVQ